MRFFIARWICRVAFPPSLVWCYLRSKPYFTVGCVTIGLWIGTGTGGLGSGAAPLHAVSRVCYRQYLCYNTRLVMYFFYELLTFFTRSLVMLFVPSRLHTLTYGLLSILLFTHCYCQWLFVDFICCCCFVVYKQQLLFDFFWRNCRYNLVVYGGAWRRLRR